jgi:predicted amidohydrolase
MLPAGLLSIGLPLALWAGGGLPFHQSGFAPGADGKPEGWTVWSHRAATAPGAYVDRVHSLGEAGSLALSGNSNPAVHGGWERRIEGIRPGAWYRFQASYRAENVTAENWQIVARLDWRSAGGKRAGQPDYAARARREGSWTRLSLDAPAPAGSAAVTIQLYLSNAPSGAVWWDEISLQPVPDPGPRNITIAAINLRPSGTGSAAESVRRFAETVERTVTGPADLILLPEGISVVGTGKSYADVAEPVPGGPTLVRLGEIARRHRSYVAAGIYEKEGQTIYNTAVLLDREGRFAGKYRKVYLPREEIEAGITPGSHYPVFRTDFGTVGMMICYDVFFADPARWLAAAGAEVILLPIWGGDETLAKARAIENKVFLVASGYDHPTYIMDPDGERLSQASQRGSAAIATLDLNRRYLDPFLGEMRTRRMKELRLDVRGALPGLEP